MTTLEKLKRLQQLGELSPFIGHDEEREAMQLLSEYKGLLPRLIEVLEWVESEILRREDMSNTISHVEQAILKQLKAKLEGEK
jgi:hypothetical protein